MEGVSLKYLYLKEVVSGQFNHNLFSEERLRKLYEKYPGFSSIEDTLTSLYNPETLKESPDEWLRLVTQFLQSFDEEPFLDEIREELMKQVTDESVINIVERLDHVPLVRLVLNERGLRGQRIIGV